jgi:hypothetical protein
MLHQVVISRANRPLEPSHRHADYDAQLLRGVGSRKKR